MERARPEFPIRALAVAVIVFNVSGNYLLDVGMRSVGQIVSLSPLDYLRVFSNAWVVSGILVQMAFLLCQLSLLSWADLTYVLPVTSLSYVLIALVSALFLKEHVSAARWLGVSLIVTGVMVVGSTHPRTAPEKEKRA
jgi:drug/metabolite transporter (DMT)-like permease